MTPALREKLTPGVELTRGVWATVDGLEADSAQVKRVVNILGLLPEYSRVNGALVCKRDRGLFDWERVAERIKETPNIFDELCKTPNAFRLLHECVQAAIEGEL